MTVTKHLENDHVMLYVEEGDLQTCITLNTEGQMRRPRGESGTEKITHQGRTQNN